MLTCLIYITMCVVVVVVVCVCVCREELERLQQESEAVKQQFMTQHKQQWYNESAILIYTLHHATTHIIL